MHIYAIFANDNINGTTHKLFEQAVDAFKQQGHTIDTLNLYDREKDIPFFRHDRKHMESYPFYIENQQRFMQADALLLVFPLFWYSVPGIMKTWLDMINAWAYQYESGMYATPKHKIKKVFVIYASMQDKQHLYNVLQNPVEQQLAETCRFIGINHIHSYIVDNVKKLNQNDLEQHLASIQRLCCTP